MRRGDRTGTDWRPLLRGSALIATLLGLGFALEITELGVGVDQAWVDAEVRDRGLRGQALFLCVGALFTAVGLPRQIISLLGGYAFGLLLGSLFGLAATVSGCAAAFLYARCLGTSALPRFAHRARRFDDLLREHAFRTTLLVRLLPVGSNLVTNVVAGLSSAHAGPFFAASALGYLPQTLVFALIGSGIGVDPLLSTALGAALFVVSGLIGASLYRRQPRGWDSVLESGDRQVHASTAPRQTHA